MVVAALHVAVAWLPGYIHPDEQLQALEPFLAGYVPRDKALVPWEFGAAPTRSWLPVCVCSPCVTVVSC